MPSILYQQIDATLEHKIVARFGDWVVKHRCLHFEPGSYSLAAVVDGEPVGFISTYPEQFPEPLEGLGDAYIDVIEVDAGYRRMGIARTMIAMTEAWARDYGYHQIRAWSSQDKHEAIPMWYALDYCICPAKIWVEWCKEVVDGYYVAKRLTHGKPAENSAGG